MLERKQQEEYLKNVIEEIIQGKRFHRIEECQFLLDIDLDVLCEGANQIRKELCGNQTDLCTIINGRSGRCSEDCKFCAQSCHHKTQIDEYTFLPEETIIEEAKRNGAAGCHRFSIVTAGRALKGAELEKALKVYRRLHKENKMKLCASHGLQTLEEFQMLKEAGVERFHANLEASKQYFPEICSTHSYEDKIENIKRAQAAGLAVCSGGIIGMGETWEDRISMALDLQKLRIQSIPLNILRPIPSTPLEHISPVSNEDVRRTVAIFRYINPTAWVRIAAGRGQFEDGGKVLFESGANSAITGDMLTTTGTSIAGDMEMMKELGYEL